MENIAAQIEQLESRAATQKVKIEDLELELQKKKVELQNLEEYEQKLKDAGFLSELEDIPSPVDKPEIEIATQSAKIGNLELKLQQKRKEIQNLYDYKSAIKDNSFLQREYIFLTDEEYEKISKDETFEYWKALEREEPKLQIRYANLLDQVADNDQSIIDLTKEIALLNKQFEITNKRIENIIGTVSLNELDNFETNLQEIRNRLFCYEKLPDSVFIDRYKEFKKFFDEYEDLKNEKLSLLPPYKQDFSDIDERIGKLLNRANRNMPDVPADYYTVVKGDYLVKIAGYKSIYNDSSKWELIYRANRDIILDKDKIYPGQILKIPRD